MKNKIYSPITKEGIIDKDKKLFRD